MEQNGYTLSDISAVTNGMGGLGGGNSLVTLLLLFALISGGGFGWNNRGDLGASAAAQQEILYNQHFNNLDNKMDRGFTNIGNGIADATFALNNTAKDGFFATQTAIKDCCCTTQRNTDSLRFDMSNYASAIQANDTANTQKILDAISQNKIEQLQGRINQLELQNAMCGTPKINPYMYGVMPYNTCGCACGNI